MGKKYAPSAKQVAYGHRIREAAKARRCIDGAWLCTRCGKHKPLSEYRTIKRLPDSVPSNCIDCSREMNRDYSRRIHAARAGEVARRKVERMARRQSELLECSRCGQSKPRGEWPVERGSEVGGFRGKLTKYCCSQPKRTDQEVKDDIASQSKVCSSCNIRKPFNDFSPNKGSQDGRQKTCKPCRSAKVHSGEWSGNSRRQATINERSDGTITTELMKQLFSTEICPCCDGYMERDDKVLDHIVPIKLGGMHSANNVTVMCWSCNAGKAARHPSRWLQLLNDEASARMRAHYSKMGLNFDD